MALARFPAVECRSAATSEPLVAVDKAGRVISIVVVPYETPADVMFRGAVWREVFSRSAFADLGSRPVRVNRGHDRARTIGKVISFDPSDRRGLVAELRIARTALGDETLTLASEDCLSASIGFSVPVGGEILDYRTRLRRVNRAVVDHIALVEDPAYADAAVLAVG
jgi:phage head maturation protease